MEREEDGEREKDGVKEGVRVGVTQDFMDRWIGKTGFFKEIFGVAKSTIKYT